MPTSVANQTFTAAALAAVQAAAMASAIVPAGEDLPELSGNVIGAENEGDAGRPAEQDDRGPG
jgi:hypothetical protein